MKIDLNNYMIEKLEDDGGVMTLLPFEKIKIIVINENNDGCIVNSDFSVLDSVNHIISKNEFNKEIIKSKTNFIKFYFTYIEENDTEIYINRDYINEVIGANNKNGTLYLYFEHYEEDYSISKDDYHKQLAKYYINNF